ncbi:hypothetical protein WA026_014669 [Henosepilachna vigintioctopunctata]|uniref:Serine protease HTRA2, mitochondrial n=1 Tax=Henosepilachna vigintioctopunctata TaxID=420089 RepID=A0AAW1V6V4_9CUCU
MHIFHKIVQETLFYKRFPTVLKKNFHSKKTTFFSKKQLFLLLSGTVFTSFYYFYLIPKWLKRERFLNTSEVRTNNEEVKLINNDEFKLMFDSKLGIGRGESAKNQYNFIDKVARECAPAVFHILISTTKPTNENTEISPFVYGSGFVIRKDGWAITNAHVVLNKDSYISCKMSDGTLYSAEIVDIDVNIDVALLKLHADKELTALTLEKPGVVDVGEWVVALGSPLSLSNSISVGVVSSVNRSARELGLKNYSMSYIQTDALITFGNSGGPLVNLDGRVIGISSLRLTSGISFAIPVEFCLKFLHNSKAFNPKARQDNYDDEEIKLFGLTTISMTSDLLIEFMQKDLLSVPKSIVHDGLLVWKVLEGSRADICGISPGDVITHIEGVPVTTAKQLYSEAKKKKEFVQLVVIKKATQEEVTVIVPLSVIQNDKDN